MVFQASPTGNRRKTLILLPHHKQRSMATRSQAHPTLTTDLGLANQTTPPISECRSRGPIPPCSIRIEYLLINTSKQAPHLHIGYPLPIPTQWSTTCRLFPKIRVIPWTLWDYNNLFSDMTHHFLHDCWRRPRAILPISSCTARQSVAHGSRKKNLSPRP